jgi:hypothetical protein
VIPNGRLCKALLDRITDQAHILETGTESYRFRRHERKAVEMTVRGKPGKPTAGFPLFPPPLEIAVAIPTFPQLR